MNRNPFEAIQFECPICLDNYDQDKKFPMMICPAQHSCCLDCLNNALFKNKGPKETIDCYFCKWKVAKQDAQKFRLLHQIKETAKTLRSEGSKIQKNIKQLGDKNEVLFQKLKKEREKNQWLIQQNQEYQWKEHIMNIEIQSSKIEIKKAEQKIKKLAEELKITQELSNQTPMQEKTMQIRSLHLQTIIDKLAAITSEQKQATTSLILKQTGIRPLYLRSKHKKIQSIKQQYSRCTTAYRPSVILQQGSRKNVLTQVYEEKYLVVSSVFMKCTVRLIKSYIHLISRPQGQNQLRVRLKVSQMQFSPYLSVMTQQISRKPFLRIEYKLYKFRSKQILKSSVNFIQQRRNIEIIEGGKDYKIKEELNTCLKAFPNLNQFAFYFRFKLTNCPQLSNLRSFIDSPRLKAVKVVVDPSFKQKQVSGHWLQGWMNGENTKKYAIYQPWN